MLVCRYNQAQVAMAISWINSFVIVNNRKQLDKSWQAQALYICLYLSTLNQFISIGEPFYYRNPDDTGVTSCHKHFYQFMIQQDGLLSHLNYDEASSFLTLNTTFW